MTTTAETAKLKRVSFKTSPAQLEVVEELARQHQRTLSGEVRMALDAWIERCASEQKADANARMAAMQADTWTHTYKADD